MWTKSVVMVAWRWITNPKEIDEKTAIPNTGVTPEKARHIVRYLYTLR